MIATRSWSRLLQILPMIQRRINMFRASSTRTEQQAKPAKQRTPGAFEMWEMALASQANLMIRWSEED